MSKNNKGKHNRRRKQALFKGKTTIPCCYCSVDLSFEEATVEHIVPIAMGGTGCRTNVTISCVDCNNQRPNDVSFDDWKKIRSQYIKKSLNNKCIKYPDLFCQMRALLRKTNRIFCGQYLR